MTTDNKIIPLREGVTPRTEDDFVQFLAEKLNDFAKANGVEPDTLVIAMWRDSPDDEGDFLWARSQMTRRGAMSATMARGTAAAILLKP